VRKLERPGREPLTEADLAEHKTAMNEALAFVNEMTFRARMADLAGVAQRAAPSIVLAFADWPKAVKDARNILAHQGTQSESESLDQFYDPLIALGYSIKWVLRTVLLIEAGIDAPTIQGAYELSSNYNLSIANAKNLLAGSPYAAPSEVRRSKASRQ
jgi:hypothetical protein